VNVSEIFIRRPIATSLLMAGIALLGILSHSGLSVSDSSTPTWPRCFPTRKPLVAVGPFHTVGKELS
jgi:hypothetical protein